MAAHASARYGAGFLRFVEERPMGSPNLLYEFGPYQVNPRERLLKRHGEELKLSPTAFRTLLYFLQNRGRLVRKEELIEKVWPDRHVQEANLTQTIFVLRKILRSEAGARFIVTSPGLGYEFVGDVRELQLRPPDA